MVYGGRNNNPAPFVRPLAEIWVPEYINKRNNDRLNHIRGVGREKTGRLVGHMGAGRGETKGYSGDISPRIVYRFLIEAAVKSNANRLIKAGVTSQFSRIAIKSNERINIRSLLS